MPAADHGSSTEAAQSSRRRGDSEHEPPLENVRGACRIEAAEFVVEERGDPLNAVCLSKGTPQCRRLSHSGVDPRSRSSSGAFWATRIILPRQTRRLELAIARCVALTRTREVNREWRRQFVASHKERILAQAGRLERPRPTPSPGRGRGGTEPQPPGLDGSAGGTGEGGRPGAPGTMEGGPRRPEPGMPAGPIRGLNPLLTVNPIGCIVRASGKDPRGRQRWNCEAERVVSSRRRWSCSR
jgi:hypothetical protein